MQWISNSKNESYEEYIKEFDPINMTNSLNSKLRLYALEKLRFFSEELQLEEDQEFSFDENLFVILINLLRDHHNIFIKNEIIEIFLNFTNKSTNFCEYLIDIDCFSIIYNLLNTNNNSFIEKGVLLIGNIFTSLKESYEHIINYFPLEIKLKELLLSGKYDKDNSIISNILWALKIILKRINEESFESVCFLFLNVISLQI